MLTKNLRRKDGYMNKLLEAVNRLYYTTAQKENSLTRKEAYKILIDYIIDGKGMTLNGKTMDEILTILNGLELERIFGIQMTMSNIKLWKEIFYREMSKTINENFEKMFKDVENIGDRLND